MDAKTLDLNFCILAQPKAGSTWLVHLLSSILHSNYKFTELEKYIPIIMKKSFNKIPFRTHGVDAPINCKKILLIRNPLDSTVSWKNYNQLRGRHLRSESDFSKYYRKKLDNNTLVVKYEDLNINTLTELNRISNFLNWNFSQNHLENAINKCSIENLKKYEQDNLDKDRKFMFYDSKQQLKNNIRFYNKGKCYTFKEYLSKSEINNIYNKYEKAINKYWPEIKEMI